jgi:hypothetical protein
MNNESWTNLRKSFAASVLCLLFAGPAWAQADDEASEETTEPAPSTEPAPPSAPPKIDVTTPEPAPPVERSYRVHDGFYLRLNIGVGTYGVQYEDSLHAAGGSLALDLLVGGSPSRGVAVGGLLISDYGPNYKLRQNDREIGDLNVETGLIGAFIDGFPNPKGGWHVGGALGLAAITSDGKQAGSATALALGLGRDESTRLDAGLGGAAWAGYDAWVGDEWSVGGLLRFAAAYGRSQHSGQNLDSRSAALTLMFTALYH